MIYFTFYFNAYGMVVTSWVVKCVIWVVRRWQMRKESEEDKQRAVAHAVATRIHNVELACQQADKQCHDEFEAERKRINQTHAAEISAVKKKQWV